MSLINVPSLCARKIVQIDTYDLDRFDTWAGWCCNECWTIHESRMAWIDLWDGK